MFIQQPYPLYNVVEIDPQPLRDDPNDYYETIPDDEFDEFGDPLDTLELQNNAWVTGMH